MKKHFLLVTSFFSHTGFLFIMSVLCVLIINCFPCLFQVWGVKYSPDGSKIVSVAEDRSINIYDCQI